MKFQTTVIADVSTSHITQRDAALLDNPDAPSRIAAIDSLPNEDGHPGYVISVGGTDVQSELAAEYRRYGFSDEFVALMAELARQTIPYVRFDRDGSAVQGAPVFDW